MFLQRGLFIRWVKWHTAPVTLTAEGRTQHLTQHLAASHTHIPASRKYRTEYRRPGCNCIHTGTDRGSLRKFYGLLCWAYATQQTCCIQEEQAYTRNKHGVPAPCFPPQLPVPRCSSFLGALTATATDFLIIGLLEQSCSTWIKSCSVPTSVSSAPKPDKYMNNFWITRFTKSRLSLWA